MQFPAQPEGILATNPKPRTIGGEHQEEEVAEFWFWNTPGLRGGYDGAVSSMHRCVVDGHKGQQVLYGESALQKEDHVIISGKLITRIIRNRPVNGKRKRLRPYRNPQHTFYMEVWDDTPDHSIQFLGRVMLADAGLILAEGWRTIPE